MIQKRSPYGGSAEAHRDRIPSPAKALRRQRAAQALAMVTAGIVIGYASAYIRVHVIQFCDRGDQADMCVDEETFEFIRDVSLGAISGIAAGCTRLAFGFLTRS